MSANAKATTTVYINNEPAKQALTELENKLKATKEARIKAFESGDQAGIKKLDREIESLNGQIDRTRKKFLDVDAVVKDLGGASIRDLNTALAKARSEFSKMRQDDPRFNEKREQIEKLNGALDAAKGKTAQATSSFGSMGGMLTKVVGWAMAAYAAVETFTSGISKIFTVRSEFEKYEAILKNTLGTQQAAREKMQELTQAAADLPIELSEVVEGYIKLKNAGLDPTMQQLTQMTDMAMSQGKSLDMYVEAMLDAQTFSYERLRQFSITASTAGDQVTFMFKGQKTTVEKNDEAIRNYLLSLGTLPGIAGSSAAVMETMAGKASNAADATAKVANAMGEGELGRVMKSTIDLYTNLANSLADYIKDSPSEKIREEQQELNALVGAIMSCNDNQVVRNQLISELQQNYPDFLGNVKAEEVTNKMLSDNLKEVNAEYVKKIQIAVIEEDIADVTKRQTDAMREQRVLLKLINKTYLERVGALSDAITLEDQLNAIAKVNTVERLSNGRTMEFSYGGVVIGWREMLKKGQAEIDALTEEYKGLFIEKTNVSPVSPTGKPVDEKKNVQSSTDTSNKTDLIKLEKERQKNQLEALESSFNEEQSIITKNHAIGKTNEATYKAQMLQAEFSYLQKKRELIVSSGESTVDIDKEIQSKVLSSQSEFNAILEKTHEELNQALINNKLKGNEQLIAAENARWDTEKKDLYDRLLFKTDLSSQEIELNNQTKLLIEAREEAHIQNLKELDINRQQQELDILMAKQALADEQNQTDKKTYEEKITLENERYDEAVNIEDTRFSLQLRTLEGNQLAIEQATIEHQTKLKKLENDHTKTVADAFRKRGSAALGYLQISGAITDGLLQNLDRESGAYKAALVAKQAISFAEATLNLAVGLSKTAAVGFPQNVPLMIAFAAETAGIIATISQVTAKGKKSGGYTDSNTSDDKVVDYVHANEFVANANAVRNPTIKPVLDIINMAQRNGTIQSINLPAALSQSGGRGYRDGGYTSAGEASQGGSISIGSSVAADPELKALIASNTATLAKLQSEGVMGVWDYDYHTRSQKKMNTLLDDVSA